jgi:hypothetical protein
VPRFGRPVSTLRWVQIALVVVGVSVSGLIVARRFSAWRAQPAVVVPPSPSLSIAAPSLASARQVTVFAIRALPGESRIDPRLSNVKAQLRKVLPDHGFELLEVQSGALDPGETLTCDLGRGWRAETTLEPPSADDFGRVRLRCELIDGDRPRFSTRVDAPENQLFSTSGPCTTACAC